MMLTNSTAEQVDVTDRLDPEQSIEGGARYLFSRIQRIPERIANPDRTWMALASYNIGLGHLEDARVLTQQQGGDPDKWVDVRQHLPLLEDKTWYQKTKYGRARGQESVVYVRNVRKYFKQLSRLAPDTPPVNNLIKTNELFNIELPAL
jgi:membrane-bound lytic murein transglycosylase F